MQEVVPLSAVTRVRTLRHGCELIAEDSPPLSDAFFPVLSAVRGVDPLGVAVVTEAQHMCMMMRGVEKQNSVTTTSAMLGAFQEPQTRAEFMTLIGTKLL